MYKEKFLYNRQIERNSDFLVWLGFAGSYSFSLSSLGFLWLFKILDEQTGVNIERICSDTTKTQYKKPDMFGFSMSFDMDFLTIFSMLEKYKINLKSKDRTQDDPIIFAGGPVVTANPEPYKEFFDFFVIGDGEDVNSIAVEICKNNKGDKSAALKELSQIEGIYVPEYPKKVKKITNKLKKCIYTPILSEDSFFKNTFIIEMTRGCSNRCGFCIASYLNLPLRSVPDDELFNVIDLGLKYTNKIALLGAQVSAHPKFHQVCEYIHKKIESGEHIEINFSSLRVDAITPDVIKTLALAGQKTITLAIEAGSERLRKVINKNISEEQIFNAVKISKENGLKGIKFYGMIGLPTETYDDLDEIINLAKKLKIENKGMDISFGFSSFVPKPNTPFQWIGRESTKSLEEKSNYLKKEMHKLGININISSIKWDFWQAVLSRGDETLGDFIVEVYRHGGKLGAFKTASKITNINAEKFALTNYSFEQEFPWDFIDVSPGKKFLIEENKRLIS